MEISVGELGEHLRVLSHQPVPCASAQAPEAEQGICWCLCDLLALTPLSLVCVEVLLGGGRQVSAEATPSESAFAQSSCFHDLHTNAQVPCSFLK